MNEYEKQANNFLHATGTKLTVEMSEFQNAPLWATGTADASTYGKKYTVTLENPKGRYVFPFWDSIHNREAMDALDLLKSFKGFSMNSHDFTNAHYKALDRLNQEFDELHRNKVRSLHLIREKYTEYVEKLKPTAYAILACLSLTYEDSFEDWADSFGYSTDSISARETYTACIEQDRQLRRLFTSEQLEKLEEIN